LIFFCCKFCSADGETGKLSLISLTLSRALRSCKKKAFWASGKFQKQRRCLDKKFRAKSVREFDLKCGDSMSNNPKQVAVNVNELFIDRCCSCDYNFTTPHMIFHKRFEYFAIAKGKNAVKQLSVPLIDNFCDIFCNILWCFQGNQYYFS
jgi:hypothetical protein